MGSSSLAAMTLWCRVLALLAFIAFVVSNQSEDTKSGALDTSYDASLDLRLNHIITKRDAKDPENKKKKKDARRKGGVRKKRLEKKRRKNQNKKRKDKKAKKNGKHIKKRNKGKKTKRKQRKNNKNKENGNRRNYLSRLLAAQPKLTTPAWPRL